MAAGGLVMAFIPYYQDLMTILSTNEDLRKSADGISQQVANPIFGTVVGGVVGGPVGAMVGGIAGAIIGYMLVDDYDSMITVLKNMSNSEREILVQKVQELVGGIGRDALTRFINNQSQRVDLLRLIHDFTKNPQG